MDIARRQARHAEWRGIVASTWILHDSNIRYLTHNILSCRATAHRFHSVDLRARGRVLHLICFSRQLEEVGWGVFTPISFVHFQPRMALRFRNLMFQIRGPELLNKKHKYLFCVNFKRQVLFSLYNNHEANDYTRSGLWMRLPRIKTIWPGALIGRIEQLYSTRSFMMLQFWNMMFHTRVLNYERKHKYFCSVNSERKCTRRMMTIEMGFPCTWRL